MCFVTTENFFNAYSGVTAGKQTYLIMLQAFTKRFCLLTVVMLLSVVNALAQDVAQIGSTGYATLDDALRAAKAGEIVKITKAGTYTLPSFPNHIELKNITVQGEVDGVVIAHTDISGGSGNDYGVIARAYDGATFKNVKFSLGSTLYHAFREAGTINMENCTIDGLLFSSGDMNFTNCQFTQSNPNGEYNMWTYSGNVTYNNCTFTNSVKGKFVNVYHDDDLDPVTITFNDCAFVNNGSVSKAAINVKATSPKAKLKYSVIVNNCTTEGAFPAEIKGDVLQVISNLVQVDDRVAGEEDYIEVTVDGKYVYYHNGELPAAQASVAQIGNEKYETLEAAFAAAQDGETITLLADCTGNGIKAPQGKFATGLTVDFAGFTYTMDGEMVGSTGTETQAFQLLMNNNITFKNGTITSEKAKILVQNYSNLTLKDMTLTLNNANYTNGYTLSNNNGNIVIDGSTIKSKVTSPFKFFR